MENDTLQFGIVAFISICALLPVPVFFAVIASILEKYQENKK